MLPKAKKLFGQNWLVDPTVVGKIVEAAEIQPDETVLEVGPGTGVLTKALVDAGARVIAVEADKSLIAPLRERFGDSIELIHGDILSLPLSSFATLKVVANIPYNITSDFLRHFLTTVPRPTSMVLMVQKEVADRITATPPHMSLLSVVCQLYAQCTKVARVPAGAFRPIPKVDSAIVRLDLHDGSTTEKLDPEEIIAVAKLGFSSPRKQLHGNLKSIGKVGSIGVKEALMSLGLPPTTRAEILTVDNWIALTHILNRKNEKHLG